MAIKIKPLGDRVVIEPSEDDAEKSAGGIYNNFIAEWLYLNCHIYCLLKLW